MIRPIPIHSSSIHVMLMFSFRRNTSRLAEANFMCYWFICAPLTWFACVEKSSSFSWGSWDFWRRHWTNLPLVLQTFGLFKLYFLTSVVDLSLARTETGGELVCYICGNYGTPEKTPSDFFRHLDWLSPAGTMTIVVWAGVLWLVLPLFGAIAKISRLGTASSSVALRRSLLSVPG